MFVKEKLVVINIALSPDTISIWNVIIIYTYVCVSTQVDAHCTEYVCTSASTIWTMDIMKSPTTNINANDSSHLKGKENLFWADLNESGLGTWICSPNSMVQHGSSYTHCYSHRWRQVINQSVFFFWAFLVEASCGWVQQSQEELCSRFQVLPDDVLS